MGTRFSGDHNARDHTHTDIATLRPQRLKWVIVVIRSGKIKEPGVFDFYFTFSLMKYRKKAAAGVTRKQSNRDQSFAEGSYLKNCFFVLATKRHTDLNKSASFHRYDYIINLFISICLKAASLLLS